MTEVLSEMENIISAGRGITNILIIGDSLTVDIQGGHNAGIDSCWFNAAGVDNKTGIVPTYEIRELLEMKQFV